jgi:hypothetical protein
MAAISTSPLLLPIGNANVHNLDGRFFMNRFANHTRMYFAVAATSLVVGCSSAEVEQAEAPSPAEGEIATLQTIYSTDSAGTWSATADAPFHVAGTTVLTVGALFTGPAGSTRRMGVCALTKAPGNVACSTVADCATAPYTLPSGGFRYCAAPEGVGQKRCYYRAGSQAAYCAGTPANGGVPISPGYIEKSVPTAAIVTWMSYACFEGCAATDPSASSDNLVINTCEMCGDRCC